MSKFSFSHGVFKRLVLQTRKNQGFFRKGLYVLKGTEQFANAYENIEFPKTVVKLLNLSIIIFFQKQVIFYQRMYDALALLVQFFNVNDKGLPMQTILSPIYKVNTLWLCFPFTAFNPLLHRYSF